MKPGAPASTALNPSDVPSDQAGIIRRSTRCFVFGLIGLVPLLGLGAAWLALRMQRQVAEETGDLLPQKPVAVYSGIALLLALGLLLIDDTGTVLAIGILLPGWHGFRLLQHYRRVEPREWNPARQLLFWGAALAYAGLVLSSTMVILNLYAVIKGELR